MSNSYYNHTTYPTPNSPGSSSTLRLELDAITTGFSLLPTLAANGYKVAMVNSAGTALIASSALQSLAITLSTLNSTPIGASTPSTGAFTTVSATTFTGALTGNASTATALATARTIGGTSFDGTANVTSFPAPGAIGGTTPSTGAFTSITASTTLGVTGVATFTAQPIVSSLTASKPVFTDASSGLTSSGTLAYDQGGTGQTSYAAGDIVYASGINTLAKLAIGTSGQRLVVAAGVPSWATDTTVGTVTSVSWTGGIVSVATATTTPAFTIAGTSGGVPYFSSGTTWATSAALAASALVIGGGAGAAPSTTTTGTGVVTALGVNTGSAGAFVVNGGALGSPSSVGTMPAFTLGGTIAGGGNQINNVVIGTTTPLAGSFTTLSANSETISTQLTLGGVVSTGVATGIALRTGSTKTAWLVGAQFSTNNAFEITPSTAAGNTTFTTPIVTVTSTGLAVTGTLSATQRITGSVGGTFGPTVSGGSTVTNFISSDNSTDQIALEVRQGRYNKDALIISTNQTNSANFLNVIENGSSKFTIGTGGNTLISGTLSGGTSGTAYSFSGSAPATSLTLDSAGNLGLGVTPSAWGTAFKVLQLANGTSLSNNGQTSYYQLGANNYFDGSDYKYIASNYAGFHRFSNAGAYEWHIAPSGTAGNTISFTQAMTLDASGNLGVGTTSFSARFTANSDNSTAYANTAPNIANCTAAFTNGSAHTSGGTFVGYQLNISGNSQNRIGYFGAVSESTSNQGLSLVFGTNTTAGDRSEKMRLDSSGNLLVGTTTASAKFSLEYNGSSVVGENINDSNDTANSTFVQFTVLGTQAGTIKRVASTSATVYNTTSDYRLKTVTGSVTGQGLRIDALKPIDYQWKEGNTPARGFLAHEFQTVYPSSVSGDKDAVDADGKPVYQAMQASTSEVIADLVAELQSLRARVAQLESKP